MDYSNFKCFELLVQSKGMNHKHMHLGCCDMCFATNGETSAHLFVTAQYEEVYYKDSLMEVYLIFSNTN
jgi:hypothetical protein